MKSLVASIKEDSNIKNNIFIKIYFLLLTVLNLIFISIEVYRSRLISGLPSSYSFTLGTPEAETKEALRAMKSMKLSRFNYNIVEKLIIYISFFFIIFVLIKYRKSNKSVKNILKLNLFYWLVSLVFGYILSLIFSIYFVILVHHMMIPFIMTIGFGIYYLVKSLYIRKYQVN